MKLDAPNFGQISHLRRNNIIIHQRIKPTGFRRSIGKEQHLEIGSFLKTFGKIVRLRTSIAEKR